MCFSLAAAWRCLRERPLLSYRVDTGLMAGCPASWRKGEKHIIHPACCVSKLHLRFTLGNAVRCCNIYCTLSFKTFGFIFTITSLPSKEVEGRSCETLFGYNQGQKFAEVGKIESRAEFAFVSDFSSAQPCIISLPLSLHHTHTLRLQTLGK